MKSKVIRVVHIFPALRQGGAENQLELILDYARDNSEHEHVVVSLLPEPTPLATRLVNAGVKMSFGQFGNKNPLFALVGLRKILANYDSDTTVYHAWMYLANLVAILALPRKAHSRLIWSIRRTDLPSGLSKIASLLCGFISRICFIPVIVNSRAAIAIHAAHYYPKSAFRYIPNGFEDEGSRCSVFRESKLVIGSIGRAVPEKGFDILLQAFSAAEASFDASIEKVKIVGRGVTEFGPIQDAIKSLGLADDVELEPEVESILGTFEEIDVLCLSSRSEGFNNVLAEGMLYGLPVVCTDVGESKEILDDPRWIVRPNDSAALAGCLARMCSLSAEERAAIGQRNRERILARYGLDKLYCRYMSLYQHQLKNGVS